MTLAAPGSGNGEDGAEHAVSAAAVRAAVDRIVNNPDFTASDRARNFLRYVVEETLNDRADRIKAFSVAVEVFGRDETFDAQNDPVVRIEAGRLRRALERYYLLSGKDDPIVIEIPKGGYVPVFTSNPTPTVPEAPAALPDPAEPEIGQPPASPGKSRARWIAAGAGVALAVVLAIGIGLYATGMLGGRHAGSPPEGPRLLVLPFTNLGNGEVSAVYSAALTDEIVSELARFKEITVFGVQTSRAVSNDADIAVIRDKYDVDYVLEGSVRADASTVRVSSRLLNTETRAVLWSRSYENPVTAADLFSIEEKTAQEVATAVAQPYGIVYRAETKRADNSLPPDDLSAYLCSLRYYTYRAAPDAEQHKAVRQCLEQAVASYPAYATAWALLGLVYVDEVRDGFNREPDSEKRALDAAKEAVRLDPENVRALQSLAMAYSYAHLPTEAFEAAQKAVEINPNDTELLGTLGLLIGLSGRLDEGRALIERALEMNPGHSSFYRGALAMMAYMQRDNAKALEEIEKVDLTGLPIYYAVAAIIYAENGLNRKARDMASQFQKMAPNFVPNLWAQLAVRNIPFDEQLHIAEGLRKAGVSVPPPPAGPTADKAPSPAGSDSRT
ncbi:MAG: adenylate cyclase [Bauldia sp.]|nr:adenylate cyclase [Bauldia sp.]